jgi:uncharacterized protein
MQIENTFEVPAPPDEVWAFMLDVEKIAPCMPGAELTEVVDESTWKGKVTVRLGPVSMSYKGTVVMEERDDTGKRAILKASGTETRGKGTASAKVTSSLEKTDAGGTRALIVADVTITGAAAQYGRGMISDVSKKLTKEFADCLAQRITASGQGGSTGEGGGGGNPEATARPVAGLRLGLWALWRAIKRFFAKLFGRRS